MRQDAREAQYWWVLECFLRVTKPSEKQLGLCTAKRIICPNIITALSKKTIFKPDKRVSMDPSTASILQSGSRDGTNAKEEHRNEVILCITIVVWPILAFSRSSSHPKWQWHIFFPLENASLSKQNFCCNALTLAELLQGINDREGTDFLLREGRRNTPEDPSTREWQCSPWPRAEWFSELN